MVPVHSVLFAFCALTVGLNIFSAEFEQPPVTEQSEPLVVETSRETPVEAKPPVEQIKPEGIDTVSLEDPQGNWLFKKIWWERAETLYGKIREAVTSIWESRT